MENRQRKVYAEPTAEVVSFVTEDVLTASAFDNEGGDREWDLEGLMLW